MPRTAPGTLLDPATRLDVPIDAGGQGEVWRATDLTLQRPVAVKVLPAADPWGDADATAQEVRATREARAIARLLHPGIAAVHRVGQWQGRPFLVMRWVPGRSLRAHLNEGKPPLATALAWLTRVGHAVQHAHDRGVLHCDLKPENIVICRDVEPEQAATLVDFGLARGPGLAHRSTLQRRGSAPYLPPETGRVPPSAASDQFALAVVACELLAGRRPRRRGDVSGLPTTLAPGLRPVLARALDADPGARFRSVSHFVDRVLAAVAPPVAPPQPDASALATDAARGRDPSGARRSSPGVACVDLAHLSPRAADALVAAAFQLSADPGLVARAFDAAALRASCDRLCERGVLEGGRGAVTPVAQAALAPLAERVGADRRRALHGRLAHALAQGDTSLPWVAEEAAAHWLAAGSPLQAAAVLDRCVGRDALARLALAARVAWLSASDGARHADAAVRWGRLAARVGRRHDAEQALGEALGALSRAELPLNSATLTLRALVRELHGEPEHAAAAWAEAAELAATDDERARALVGRARSLLRGAPLPARIAASSAARHAAARCPDPAVGVAAWLVTGLALEGAGRPEEALLALQTSVTEALSLGVPLVAADALLALAEGLRRRGRLTEAAQQCDEADDALAHEGPVAAGGTSWLVRGRVALDSGEPWRAALDAQAARVRFADLGLQPRVLAAWQLTHDAAMAAGQPTLAREAKAAAQRLRRRAGRPVLGDDAWWVDGPA